MKKVLAPFFLLTIALANAQITEMLDEFREVKVFDDISMNMIRSDDNKVIVTGEDVKDVAIVNRNDRLKIQKYQTPRDCLTARSFEWIDATFIVNYFGASMRGTRTRWPKISIIE